MTIRYGLSLKLDCDNAAFEEDRVAEIARIFRELGARIEQGAGDYRATINNGSPSSGLLYDLNGNSCGSWDIKPRRLRD